MSKKNTVKCLRPRHWKRFFLLQSEVADVPRSRRRRTFPDGRRSFYFLVQISCECIHLEDNHQLKLIYFPHASFGFPSLCRTSSEKSRTLWWWTRSITCLSSQLTARAKWARWDSAVLKVQDDVTSDLGQNYKHLFNNYLCLFLCVRFCFSKIFFITDHFSSVINDKCIITVASK